MRPFYSASTVHYSTPCARPFKKTSTNICLHLRIAVQFPSREPLFLSRAALLREDTVLFVEQAVEEEGAVVDLVEGVAADGGEGSER